MMHRTLVVACAAVIALAFSQTPTNAAGTPTRPRVDGISHHHPRSKSFSFLAARIKATPGSWVKAVTRDGEVLSKPRVVCKANARGRALAVWKIDDPALYNIEVTITKGDESVGTMDSYRVPFPPMPTWGPFHFKPDAGCHPGWPVS